MRFRTELGAPSRGLLSVALVAAGLCLALAACGPRHLSALGNPGDLCTERSSCVEGSECRITETGYRCVERGGRPPSPERETSRESSSGFTPATGDEEPASGGPSADDDSDPPESTTRARSRRRHGRR